jgi:putative restriction endonuclease
MFAHLQRLTALHPEGVTSADLNAFTVAGRGLKLVVQPGIWKPADLEAALTIRTTYTAPNQMPPYQDDIATGGLIKYAYRGTDPEHSDNRALRIAMQRQLPLAYFVGVAKSVYQAHFPSSSSARGPPSTRSSWRSTKRSDSSTQNSSRC